MASIQLFLMVLEKMMNCPMVSSADTANSAVSAELTVG